MNTINGINSRRNSGVKSSIKTKLLIAFLSLSLLPLAAIGIVSFLQSQNTFTTQTQEELANINELQYTSLMDWLQGRKNDIQVMASMPDIQSMDPAVAGPHLKLMHTEWKIYESSILIGVDGKTVATNDDSVNDLSSRQYFKDAMTGKVVISQPVVSKISGNVIIVAAAPVYRDKQIVGVAAMTITTSYIADLLKAAQQGKTGEAYLIDSSGMFLTPSRNDAQLKSEGKVKESAALEFKIDTQAAKSVAAGKDGGGSYKDYLGNTVIGSYKVIPEQGWGLVVEQDSSEALASVTTLFYITLAVFAVSAVIVILIGIFLANGIANPIKTMSTVAKRLADGDIKQNINHTGSDEVGELADSFRSMIGFQQIMAETAHQIANGDLTVVVNPKSNEDILGSSFVTMISTLRSAINELAANTVNLNSASTQLASASNQAGNATEQIATTIQQVSSGAIQQSESATKTAQAVEQLTRAIDGVATGAQEQAKAVTHMAGLTSQISSAIEQVSNNAREVTDGAKDASDTASQGAAIVEVTVEGMTKIRQKVGLSASKVEEMGNRSDQIGAIVATIEDIASQTNLLALNAAIEAARAGEHGKGFAVVADEVRKLAEKSSAATKEIGGLIKGIQQTVAEAVVAMHESAQEVEVGVKHAGDAGVALQNILKSADSVKSLAETVTKAADQMQSLSNQLITSADEVSAIVEENTAATEEMSAGSSEITHAIENIASVSEENSASVEEVSAAAEQMSAQVEEVSASADSLSQMAEDLTRIVSKFKLS
jgi:methyl-accepting chemotaxis protein